MQRDMGSTGKDKVQEKFFVVAITNTSPIDEEDKYF